MQAANFAPEAAAGANCPSLIVAHSSDAPCGTALTHDVSTVRHSSCGDLQREVAIQQAGREIEAAMARYAESGNFADRGEADAARLRMQGLIAGRSAEQVARMEAEMARRMAREPGANQ